MVGASYLREHGSELVAEAVVRGGPGGFALKARITKSGVSETKTMEAERCETLADAYAVIVAFVIDPASGVRQPGPEGWDAVAAMPAIASARAEVMPRTPTATEAAPPSAASAQLFRPPAVGVGPVAAVGAGLLPFPALGVGARVSVQAGPRWELAGMYWPERFSSVSVSPSSAVGALVDLATIGPSVCLPLLRGAVASCLGVDVGAMRGIGADVPHPNSGRSWWVAPTSSLAVRLMLARRVSLRFRLDAGIPIFRPSFVVDNVGQAGSVETFRPAPAFGAISLEAEVQLFSTDSDSVGHNGK
jgi:hypothetical protein